MDLIYADETRKDIGVIHSYTLDMAYGEDENNFTCSVARDDHCCDQGFFIYIENEEFGGIVDTVKVNTESDEVCYKGRTWHGILEGKAICPDDGDDYYIADGDAHAVISDLIEHIGLSDLFEVAEGDSGIEIVSYEMDRYAYAYTGIRAMLKEFSGKLKFNWQNGMVVLSVEPLSDFSQNEEFDVSQVDFVIEKNFRPPNHIICLGQGDLKDRAVIHIFTDEEGGVQPYATTSKPVKNADYILDTSQQLITGHDEVVRVLDYASAAIATNYVALTSEPSNWARKYANYYFYDSTIDQTTGEEIRGSYRNVDPVVIEYEIQKSKPSDWDENFNTYFTYDPDSDRYTSVSGVTAYEALTCKPGGWSESYEDYYTRSGSTYSRVEGIESIRYVKQKKRPSDWAKNYDDYYEFYSDGVITEYRRCDGYRYDTYDRQTRKPTDWTENFRHYYRRATSKELKADKTQQWYSVEETKSGRAPKWQAKKYYTRNSHEKAPGWSKKTRYTRIDTVSAPSFSSGTYYEQVHNSAPTWARRTYYTKTNREIAPKFVARKYFRQVTDQYAELVRKALENLEEYHKNADLSIKLEETEQTYDIGDIVGTLDRVTGLSAIQEVVKKIVKINNNDIYISYEVK